MEDELRRGMPSAMSVKTNFRHRDCYYCGPDGYLFNGDIRCGDSMETSMVIDHRHEGWPGIPHGGVGMTSFIELADIMDGALDEYPWRADFRLGGDTIEIKDDVRIRISRAKSIYIGEIRKKGGAAPYLCGTLERRTFPALEKEMGMILGLLQKPVRVKSSFIIPVFSDMIIFRKQFQSSRLNRTFEMRETAEGGTYMVSLHGDARGLMCCDEMNTIHEDRVHPGALVTILDETLGWAGFLSVWQGGVTVNLSAYFMRPVCAGDYIFSAGLCSAVKGSYRRKIVSCSGGIFIVRGDEIIPAVFASGRWLTEPEYKERMLRYIMP